MRTFAIVSDVHANYAALVRCLKAIAALSVDGIASLGDIIGYGPHPTQCLRAIMECASLSVVGNHDAAVRSEDWSRFNPAAARATEWTLKQLQGAPDDHKLMEYLLGLGLRATVLDALLVHGSPRDPVEEYIFPRDVEDPWKMDRIFESFEERWCFTGHTHQPGAFVCTEGRYLHLPSSELPNGFTLTGNDRAIVNVGSVGQPRDGDPRACFVTFDGSTVRWHRVEYSVRFTQSQIRKTEGLPNYLAERLETGS